MTFEVEQKFWVDDLAAVRQRLQKYDTSWGDSVVQTDCYFAHPARHFAETDEALRIRQVGDCNRITYKGPKLAGPTKTRREIELPLAPGDDQAEAWRELLAALGFSRVAEVRKTRQHGTVLWQGKHVEVSLDTVDRLGTFVELEIVTDEQGIEQARASIVALAAALSLSRSERHSYLELLLALPEPRAADDGLRLSANSLGNRQL